MIKIQVLYQIHISEFYYVLYLSISPNILKQKLSLNILGNNLKLKTVEIIILLDLKYVVLTNTIYIQLYTYT